jgi:hypothetical protein
MGPVSFGTSALIILLAALGRLLWRGPLFAPVLCCRASYVQMGVLAKACLHKKPMVQEIRR